MRASAVRIFAAFAVLALAAPEARATAGTAFAESSRSAALGNAMIGRPGDSGTMLLNPAGLANVVEPELLFAAQLNQSVQRFARSGEDGYQNKRWSGAYSLAVATPMPGPEWLSRLRFGLAVDMPAEHVLRVAVDERLDRPVSPIYDGRGDRVSMLTALAYEILPELSLGAGLQLTPSLNTPTEVTYDANRGDTADEDIVVRLERDLVLDVAPFVGVRAQPLSMLGVGLVYRKAAISRAKGKLDVTAGGIVARDPIDYVQYWQPTEFAAGVMGGPLAGFSLSIDATWSRWSEYRDAFNHELDQPFEDTLTIAAGLEYDIKRTFFARAGYAFEPTPVPDQTGDTNYLGADTHVISIGGGVDLRKLSRAPLAIDIHARGRFGGTQKAEKNEDELSDANPNVDGQQIDNLGYPGFESSAKLYQIGFTLTLFIGKEKPR